MHTLYGVAIATSLEFFSARYAYVGRHSRTPSRLIVGATAIFVLAVMAGNFGKAPPVGFVNVEGYWIARGAGPQQGCLWLKQDGAGVTLTGFLSRDALESDIADLSGRVDGKQLTLQSAKENPAADIAVLKMLAGGTFSGHWKGYNGDWTLTPTDNACM